MKIEIIPIKDLFLKYEIDEINYIYRIIKEEIENHMQILLKNEVKTIE